MHVQRHDHPELAALASLCSVQTFMNLQDVLGVEYLILEAGSSGSNYGFRMILCGVHYWHCDDFLNS